MNGWQTHRTNLVVVLYALAMAWVEAAVVLDLRTILGEMRPFPPPQQPLPMNVLHAELVREAATMVMLATVGWLSGRGWIDRFGRFLIAFGVWDIFYYVFLSLLTGFPRSLLEWDILFLLPLPWWGPVYAPCSIALLMILTGWLLTFEQVVTGVVRPGWWSLACCAVGIVLALFVFMEDALGAVWHDPQRLMQLVPENFRHELFWLSWVLMAMPFFSILRGLHRQRPRDPARWNR